MMANSAFNRTANRRHASCLRGWHPDASGRPSAMGTKLLACPTLPRWSPGSAVLISLPGTALIPRLRSGCFDKLSISAFGSDAAQSPQFRQRAQTPARGLNFG